MMKRLLSVAVLLASATPAAPEPAPDRLPERLGRLVDAYADVYGFSGTVKVVDDESEIFERSVGLADRSFGVPFAPTTRTSINSISKTFTAAALLRYVDRGRLDLSAPVGRYLNDLGAEWKDRVTLHHLLSHSSGLPREAGLDEGDERTLSEQLETVGGLALEFEPGSRYGYSNAGYIVLGNVLERVSGLDYAEAIRRETVEPLHLADTGVYEDSVVVTRQAVPYRMTPAGVGFAQRTKIRGESAGGGMYSTPGDLYRWVRALEDDSLLHAASRERLFHPHVAGEGSDFEGYAWSIKSFGARALRFAAGSGYGTKSVVVRDPEAGDFIAIVSNWGNTPILALLRDLFLTLDGRSVDPPTRDALADPEDYRTRLGAYRFDEEALRHALQTDDGIVRLHAHEGRLFLDDELLARGPDGTLRLTYTGELSISFDDASMTLEIGGRRLVGERID